MSVVGIDLEQFIRDPWATGIQRVMQQLARNWPDEVGAEFVLPNDDGTFTLLDRQQATDLLTLPFVEHGARAGTTEPGFDANHHLRTQVNQAVLGYRDDRAVPKVRLGELISIYDAWLLPEVSYLPAVLERLDLFGRCMPVAMIGYDALPMTDPANYRFRPGTSSQVSGYFRRLATVDAVVCISGYARDAILDRLRRDRSLRTTVAHPGGDHIPVRESAPSIGRPTFLRVGTMEARKRPAEILRGFLEAVHGGLDAELVFIGNPNASSAAVNAEVAAAVDAGEPVRWIQGASDQEVTQAVIAADAFLSIGIEGYGIPVLEAIRLGTPVVFDGIQPAAELMAGRGATRLPAHDEAHLADMFRTIGHRDAIDNLRAQCDPYAVPTWNDFAGAVAAAAVDA